MANGFDHFELRAALMQAGLRVVDSKHHSPGGGAATRKLLTVVEAIYGNRNR